MKVLHILNTGSYSGAENVVISIINNTKDKVDSVYVSLDGSIKDILSENNISFHPIEKLNYKNIKKVILEERPDIIHAHDFTASIICSFFSKKTPIISHIHCNPSWIKEKNLKSYAYLFSSRRFAKILTVSNSICDEYVFANKIINKTSVINNPIMINNIIKKSELYKCDNNYDVLFVGRLVEEKNPLIFVKIILTLKNKFPNIKAGIIGNGILLDNVKKIIIENNLEKNIDCLGFINNPYPYIKNSKILCITSKWEGFGLVAVEAIALGKPVVSSNVGGLPNILNSNCGLLCNEFNDYINEITKLLSDSEYYILKSNGAYKRAKDIDNTSTYFKNIINIYDSLLKEK